MRFLLTLHLFRILTGRGLRLHCEKCKFPIHVKVQCKCNVCGHISEIIGEWNDKIYALEIRCEKCNSDNCTVAFTQWVQSKHRKGNHNYYHDECWSGMFYA